MKITASGFDQLKKSAAAVRAMPEAVERAKFRSINTVAERLMVQARRDIGAEMNLTATYIREQMKLLKASRGKLLAVIRVRRRHVRLARYGAKQLTRNAPRAKGDALRGVAARRAQAGVSVAVKRGARKNMRGAFMLPLRAGKADGGNGLGVFFRTGKGPEEIEHKYGPSPYQMFERWKNDKRPDINRMLAEAFRSQLRYELKGSRK